MPNPSPNRQKTIPISSSLWPSIALFRKLTADRSGSFSEASPPAASSEGCARAAAARSCRVAAVAKIFADQHARDRGPRARFSPTGAEDAVLAVQVRIRIPPVDQSRFKDWLFPACIAPQLVPSTMGKVAGLPNTLPLTRL